MSILSVKPYMHQCASLTDDRLRSLPEASMRSEGDVAPKKLIRVLHIINGEHYAGAERAQDLLAMRLPDFGYEVTFVCLKQGRFPEMRQSQETPLYVTPMRWRFDLRPALFLKNLMRSGNFRLVHTHTPRSALIGGLAARWSGLPLVHHVQSPTSQDSIHVRWNRLIAQVERMSLSRVAALIPVSKSLENYVNQHGTRAPHTAIVPNGVPAPEMLTVRTPPVGSWTIGTMALFRPRKGLDVLLEAFTKLRSAGYPVRLRAVGRFETADYEAKIADLVERLGIDDAIDWRGFQHDVRSELETMDLFVLPSLFGEGLPFVVLEAMSAGVPVVSTAVEGIPEAIRNGRDGLIVPPADAPALAEAIRRVLDNEIDWQSLRSSAFQRQSNHYTDMTMAAGVADVYSTVLRGGPAKDENNIERKIVD